MLTESATAYKKTNDENAQTFPHDPIVDLDSLMIVRMASSARHCQAPSGLRAREQKHIECWTASWACVPLVGCSNSPFWCRMGFWAFVIVHAGHRSLRNRFDLALGKFDAILLQGGEEHHGVERVVWVCEAVGTPQYDLSVLLSKPIMRRVFSLRQHKLRPVLLLGSYLSDLFSFAFVLQPKHLRLSTTEIETVEGERLVRPFTI